MTTLNPDFVGFRCLRCQAAFEIQDYFEGCPNCAGADFPVSLAASYGAGVTGGPCLPLLNYPKMGEGNTPILELSASATALDLEGVWLKAEGANPTGSHKDRMSSLVCARAKMLGRTWVVASSSGNAGVSLAAYAAHCGLKCHILTNRAIPGSWRKAMRSHGADLQFIDSPDARWTHTQKLVHEQDYYPATNYLMEPVGSNPFGVQGYKSVGYEIAAQFEGQVPDWILVPCARGDLLWGIWQGLDDLRVRGSFNKVPKLIAVEPFPRLNLVLRGKDYRSRFPGSTCQYSTGGPTVTWQALHALRASCGSALVVTDDQAAQAKAQLESLGIRLERCAAATLSALHQARDQGLIAAGERVLLIGTSNGIHEQ